VTVKRMAEQGRTHIAFLDPPVVKERPKDPVSGMILNQQTVRESIIAHEEINMLRDKVEACYWKEGVNHLENCKEVVAAYRARIDGHFPTWGALQAPKE